MKQKSAVSVQRSAIRFQSIRQLSVVWRLMSVVSLSCLMAGCASYRIPTPCGEATLLTFCKTVDLPKITMTSTGDGRTSNATIIVEGYASKGDTEVITASASAIGAIAGAAAKAAAK